jgi:hypothetical protein
VNLTEERLLLRDVNISEIKGIIRDNPIDLLYNFDLTISDDLFMEVLLNNFRNDVTSYQAFISKFKNNEKTALIKKISEEWELLNWDSVDILEDKLTKLNEQLLRDRLTNSNLFDILNNEKMTPMFLKLAKISNNQGSLSEIKSKEGMVFETPELREKYIYEHFQSEYGKVSRNVTVGDIEAFLGPGLINCNIVNSCKIPDHLKVEMENEISLSELDNAVKSSKNNTAGGMDGINNLVLKKFWDLLRIPLYNYTKLIPIKGKLTQSFNSAAFV